MTTAKINNTLFVVGSLLILIAFVGVFFIYWGQATPGYYFSFIGFAGVLIQAWVMHRKKKSEK
jgi:hypothetical protein